MKVMLMPVTCYDLPGIGRVEQVDHWNGFQKLRALELPGELIVRPVTEWRPLDGFLRGPQEVEILSASHDLLARLGPVPAPPVATP